MDSLSVLDAGFLQAEDADRHVNMAIGALAVLAGPMPDFEALSAAIDARTANVPRLRQVLRTQPLDLAAPHWEDDPQFDVTHHVRRAALPRPGDDAALFRWVADEMERRLDRDRPLWECWVADGLVQNRWAILIKLHHCVADGIAATNLLARLCDDLGDPETFATELRRDEPAAPSGWRPSLNPVEWIAGAWRTSRQVTDVAARVVRGTTELATGLLRPAESSLTGPVGTQRSFAGAEVPMEDVTVISERFGVTVNDVALAAITESFREILLERGEKPRAHSLRTLVPATMRAAPATAATDNRVSVMMPYLPVDEADPIARLRTVHTRLTKTKASGQRQAVSILTTAANAVPFPLTAWTVRLFTRLPQRGVVTLATNVPGPRRRQFVMGREVIRLVPIPPLALQLRTAIAILSYADHLAFGIIGDYDSSPDVAELAAGIERAVARLAVITLGPTRFTPVGMLALVQGG